MTGAPLLLINLDRSTERLACASEEFERLGLAMTRLPAIDGRRLSTAQLSAAYDPILNRRRYFAPLHRGEIACFLSHRLAWERIVASGARFGVVFEDDVVLGHKLPAVLTALDARPLDWDVVKLFSANIRVAQEIASLAEGVRLVRPWVVALSGAAYCVSGRGAQKLLAGGWPITRPIDVELQHWWEHDLVTLAVEPSVASVRDTLGGSTISVHGARGPLERLSREIRRPVHRAKLALRSFVETRIARKRRALSTGGR